MDGESTHTKGFQELVRYACEEHSLTHQALSDAFQVLRHLISVFGDKETLLVVDV